MLKEELILSADDMISVRSWLIMHQNLSILNLSRMTENKSIQDILGRIEEDFQKQNGHLSHKLEKNYIGLLYKWFLTLRIQIESKIIQARSTSERDFLQTYRTELVTFINKLKK